ncbi:hypothetical protein [Nocardiopsis coralliicola]
MFQISLTPPSAPPAEYEVEMEFLDHYETTVMDICVRLRGTDVTFRVSGFGEEWRTEEVELSTFVEELPEAMAALRAGEPAVSWFYEQGLQRKLFYYPEGDMVRIHCVPDEHAPGGEYAWEPNPDTEWVARADLDRMFHDVAVAFAQCARVVAPEALSYEPFSTWITGRT